MVNRIFGFRGLYNIRFNDSDETAFEQQLEAFRCFHRRLTADPTVVPQASSYIDPPFAIALEVTCLDAILANLAQVASVLLTINMSILSF
jgi:hypothetical protein